MKWIDTTNYSRGDKERKPTVWTIDSGPLKITVTCGHIHYRGLWIMHCFELGIDTFLLKRCESLLEAKQRAIAIVKNKISTLQEAVDNLVLE